MKNKRGIVCVFILAGVLASAIVPGFAYQAEKSNRGAITDIVQTAGECRDTEIGKTKGMGAEAAEAEAKAPDQAQIEGFSPVSYTHLDVYKRQMNTRERKKYHGKYGKCIFFR